MNLLEGATVALIVLALLATAVATWRLLLGPQNADRIVALDIFLAAAVVLCIGASLATGRTVFMDVGIGLALVGFVATIGWARLVDRSPRGGTVPAEEERA